MKLSFFSLVMLLIFAGCTSEELPQIPEHIKELENLTIHSPSTEHSGTITLEKEQVFEETDDVLWGRVIRDITTDQEGRVFIADMASNMIHVYHPDGTFQTSLGRQGQGPGEFNEIWNLKTDDTHLHVLDLMHQRISLFDLNAYSHAGDVDVGLEQFENNPPETWPAFDDLVVDDQNRLWVSTIVDDFNIREWWVMDLDASGELLGQITMPGNERIKQIKNGKIYTIKQDFEVGLRQVLKYRINFNI